MSEHYEVIYCLEHIASVIGLGKTLLAAKLDLDRNQYDKLISDKSLRLGYHWAMRHIAIADLVRLRSPVPRDRSTRNAGWTDGRDRLSGIRVVEIPFPAADDGCSQVVLLDEPGRTSQ